MDYTELVKSLRYCSDSDTCCSLCGRFAPECELTLMGEAADAIEELQQTVKHYKGCADDWYKEACDYKARLERAKSMVICEAEHTEMFDDRDKKTLMEMAKSLPYLVLTDNTPRWISVEERLPEDIDEEVLVCTEDYGINVLGFVTVATYGSGGWLECWERKTYLTDVTHWMPLPTPPKEETE